MLKKTKLVVMLAIAAAAMMVAASSASAITANVSRGGAVNATGTSTFEGSGISIVCPLTLATNLSTGPITVARGNSLGSITGVTIGACTGGSVERVLALPWSLTINDTLPTIERLTTTNATGVLMNINGASFNLSTFGGFLNCLYRGTAGALLTLTPTSAGANTYTARTLRALETVSLPLVSGSGCPATGHFAGTFTLSAVQTVTLT